MFRDETTRFSFIYRTMSRLAAKRNAPFFLWISVDLNCWKRFGKRLNENTRQSSSPGVHVSRSIGEDKICNIESINITSLTSEEFNYEKDIFC